MQKCDVLKNQLKNGVRIISEKIPGVRSVSTGIWVGAGSRFEKKGQEGISHFVEHLMFKGTKKRSAGEIAEALDAVGGQLNAFTTKEFTCYYTKTLDEHFPLGLDVLSDMFFNSVFSKEALVKERDVIEEEIKMYEDSPDDLIHDFFTQTAWPNHPLGQPILGTAASLAKIERETILNYLQEIYIPQRVVVVTAGNLEHELVQEQVAQIFSAMEPREMKVRNFVPQKTRVVTANLKRQVGQVQICLGTVGLSQKDERLYVLYVLNNILGGSLSSRLVQSIRENRGLAYSVFSYHSTFCDTGLLAFYAGTSPEKYAEVISLFLEEIRNVMQDGVTEKELKKAKEQIKGNLFLGLENVSSRMSRLGRNELCLNRIVPLAEIVARITKVTLEDVQELARDLFTDKQFTLSTIGPLEEAVDWQTFWP